MLYSAACGVSAAARAHTVTVTNVTNNTVTISAALDAGYVGGTIKASDGTIRMIVALDATFKILTLMRPVLALITDFAANPGGFTATTYTGCDKSSATCRDKFGNIGNFGGFPGITGINPMAGVSNVF
jgi:hypothetical protein